MKRKRYSMKKWGGNWFIWDRKHDGRYIAMCPRHDEAVRIRTALNRMETAEKAGE